LIENVQRAETETAAPLLVFPPAAAL
jgi:hypothetical protein